MTDLEFEKADAEVLALFRRPKTTGGDLPRVTVKVLPADRADHIIALDQRLQRLWSALPWLLCAAILGLSAASMLMN